MYFSTFGYADFGDDATNLRAYFHTLPSVDDSRIALAQCAISIFYFYCFIIRTSHGLRRIFA